MRKKGVVGRIQTEELVSKVDQKLRCVLVLDEPIFTILSMVSSDTTNYVEVGYHPIKEQKHV